MSVTNKTVVSDMIQAVWRAGHLERLADYWTADCVNHAAPEGAQRGLAALRIYHEGFAQAFAGFTDMKIDLLQQIAEADRVVTQIRTTAHHTASGKTVTLDTIRIDRLEHGKIAEHWSVADMAGLMRQLGQG